jgi:hypothetical protein
MARVFPKVRSRRRIIMKNSTRRFIAIAVVGLALITPIKMAFADSEKVGVTDSALFKRLSAEWWQWALSIPTSVNPMLDTTGQNGVVGQRGSIWFLAGTFGGGTVTRTCAVPEDRALFFPVITRLILTRLTYVDRIPTTFLSACCALLLLPSLMGQPSYR